MREVAEAALFLRHIRFEAMLIVEEQQQALALQDQGIERREDMNAVARSGGRAVDGLRPRPVLERGAFDADAHELSAPRPRLDEPADRRLASGVEVADRVQADESL